MWSARRSHSRQVRLTSNRDHLAADVAGIVGPRLHQTVMPREGAIIFRDLFGKLDVLNVECDKCGRRGRYHLHRLMSTTVSTPSHSIGPTRSRPTAHGSAPRTSTTSAVRSAQTFRRWCKDVRATSPEPVLLPSVGGQLKCKVSEHMSEYCLETLATLPLANASELR
jgi:hypothetical protein